MDTLQLETILKAEKTIKTIRECSGYKTRTNGFIASISPDGKIRVGEPVTQDKSQYWEQMKRWDEYKGGPVSAYPDDMISFYYGVDKELFEQRLTGYTDHFLAGSLERAALILDTEWVTDDASEETVRRALASEGKDFKSTEISFSLTPSTSQLVGINELRRLHPPIPVIGLLGEYHPSRSENIRLLAIKSHRRYLSQREVSQVWDGLMMDAMMPQGMPSSFISGKPEIARGTLDLEEGLLSFD